MTSPRVAVLTGAGISADSGVETFRDSGGLWHGHRVEDVATPEAWARDPAMVWRFYQRRRAQLLEVEPNAAHHALAVLGRRLEERGGSLTLISQNVDDLHQRAGSEVLAMHGQLRRLRCGECFEVVEDLESLDPDRFVPCPACACEALRPDVVWFGEMPIHMVEIESAVYGCDVFAAIGTSGVVFRRPASSPRPGHAARRHGCSGSMSRRTSTHGIASSVGGRSTWCRTGRRRWASAEEPLSPLRRSRKRGASAASGTGPGPAVRPPRP